MVVGNGLVAKAFSQYSLRDDVLVYASGVSNSKETDVYAYEQEIRLVKEMITEHPDKTFVYFSTTSIDDHSLKDKQYVRHKLHIESVIQELCSVYHIFRVSNIVGHTSNPHTIINFFVNQIKTGSPFALWTNAYRNIIDIDDVVRIVTHIIDNKEYQNNIINVAYPKNISTVDIVEAIEDFLQKKAICQQADFGGNYLSSTDRVMKFFDSSHLNPQDYLRKLLHKYVDR